MTVGSTYHKPNLRMTNNSNGTSASRSTAGFSHSRRDVLEFISRTFSTMSEMKFIDDRERLEKLAPVAAAKITRQVFVCTGKSCSAVGSGEVKAAFETRLESAGLRFGKESKGRNPKGPIVLTDCGSVGFCSVGPAVLVYPDGIWYAQVRASDVQEIIDEHLVAGRVVDRLVLKELPPDSHE